MYKDIINDINNNIDNIYIIKIMKDQSSYIAPFKIKL